MADFERDSKTFDEALTFTRASTGTYFDNQGVLQTAAVDEPRFDHDPVTGEALGLLIEEQRTNICTRSEGFASLDFWDEPDGVTVTDNQEVAPNGEVSASLVAQDATTGQHSIKSVSVFATGSYYYTVFAKDAGRGFVQIANKTNTDIVNVDLSTGDFFSSSPSTEVDVSELPNGWFKISVLFDVEISGIYNALILSLSSPRLESYGGGGGLGVYLWGAQLEQGSFPTSYIKTEGSQVTRSADNCSRTLGTEFNASEGTFLMEFDVTFRPSVTNFYLSGGSNRRLIYGTSPNAYAVFNGTQIREYPAIAAPEGYEKLAISVFGKNQVLARNGNSNSFADVAGDSLLDISSFGIMGTVGIAKVKTLKLFPRALSAEELEELTAP